MAKLLTHAELHLSVRRLLEGTSYQAFQISTVSTEHHPERVFVDYVVHVSGLTQDFRSADQLRLLAWVRNAVNAHRPAEEEIPAALTAIGGPPRLRRVK